MSSYLVYSLKKTQKKTANILIGFISLWRVSHLDVEMQLQGLLRLHECASVQRSVPSRDRADGIKATFMSAKPDVKELS